MRSPPAAHVQIREWEQSYDIHALLSSGDLTSALSKEEEEAMDETTMGKMQGMHLQILKLREENDKLRERTRRKKRNKKEVRPMADDGKIVTSGMVDDGKSITSGMMDQSVSICDETSQASGVTQMTSAMKGFLKDKKRETQQQKHEQQKTRHRVSVATAVSASSPKSKRNPLSPDRGPMAKSPRSILRNHRGHNSQTRTADRKEQNARVRPRDQPAEKRQQPRSEVPRHREAQRQQQKHHRPQQQRAAAQHRSRRQAAAQERTRQGPRDSPRTGPRHPGPSESPKRTPKKTNGRGTTKASGATASRTEFASFDNMQFAEFADGFGSTKEKDRWTTSRGGDEESEV